jgi:hypothetical protein
VTIDITTIEAEILIAVLTGAEMAVNEPGLGNPALAEALAALRPWRTSLLQAYLLERMEGGRVQ